MTGALEQGSIIDEYEEIGLLERACEYIMLGMRTVRGISMEEYQAVCRGDFRPLETALERMRENGWARCTDGRWHFTPRGFLVSNQLIGALLDAQAEQRLTASPWIRA